MGSGFMPAVDFTAHVLPKNPVESAVRGFRFDFRTYRPHLRSLDNASPEPEGRRIHFIRLRRFIAGAIVQRNLRVPCLP